MEDVLDLYAEAPIPTDPVVCFDESPTQLIGEVREPIPAKPGQLERYDCEYRRNGTVNLFVFLDAHRPWRKVKVTDTNQDFAQRTKTSPTACAIWSTPIIRRPIIRVGDGQPLDPLSRLALRRIPAPEADACSSGSSSHHTPKHASWLNMVEIEIGVLAVSAWTAASTTKINSSPRSPLGSVSATPRKPDQLDVHHREGTRKTPQSLSRQES